MACDDSNVRSIQGEQQGELLSTRRVKFNGMSLNDLGEALPRGGYARFIVEGTVVGKGEQDRADGNTMFWDVVKVDSVQLAEAREPKQDPQLPLNDDVAEG